MADKKNPGSGHRVEKTRVKTARKRTPSSTRWLERQLNDPYVQRSKKDGYRCRAVYKILELDDKFRFFKPGKRVLDLGAAPGGWTQIAVERCQSPRNDPRVVAMDILAMEPMRGAICIQMDFMAEDAPDKLRKALGGKADIVMSDMAPNTTGHAATDHLRIMGLLEAAYAFAQEILAPGGVFVAKVFQGGTEQNLLTQMRKDFSVVKHAKPKSSRSDSSEMYVVATGFRG
ncbi:MAG: RlmE family RNA methyltransferase [Alphaproteobacteria bacterium]